LEIRIRASGASPGACGCAKTRFTLPKVANGKWSVKSILDVFCNGDAEDRAVVTKLKRLKVDIIEPLKVNLKKYKNGKWVDDSFQAAGTAGNGEIEVDTTIDNSEAASTFYHEVVHTDQPSSMSNTQAEYDAYAKEEAWRIKRGLPPARDGKVKLIDGTTRAPKEGESIIVGTTGGNLVSAHP